MTYKNWKLERETSDQNAGLAWAILDTANSSTNTLGAEVMAELGLILDECEKNPPKGLIFKSAKEAGFIAGANIEEFTTADTPQKARALVKRGWDAYNRLAASRDLEALRSSASLCGRHLRPHREAEVVGPSRSTLSYRADDMWSPFRKVVDY